MRKVLYYIKEVIIIVFWLMVALLFIGVWSSNWDLIPLDKKENTLVIKERPKDRQP